MQTEIKNRLYTLAGITDERTDCDCCGRSNLKRTMVLKPTDGGDFVFFGTGCGSKALTWAESEKPARKMSAATLERKAEQAQQMADMQARFSAINAAMEAHKDWHIVVETEARIACPEGVTFREYLSSLRATPGAYEFYTAQRTYANALRAEIKAEVMKEMGL